MFSLIIGDDTEFVTYTAAKAPRPISRPTVSSRWSSPLWWGGGITKVGMARNKAFVNPC
jgi:hypothetical protein